MVLWVQQNRPIPIELLRLLIGAHDEVCFDLIAQECVNSASDAREIGVALYCMRQAFEQQERAGRPSELLKEARRCACWRTQTPTLWCTISRPGSQGKGHPVLDIGLIALTAREPRVVCQRSLVGVGERGATVVDTDS